MVSSTPVGNLSSTEDNLSYDDLLPFRLVNRIVLVDEDRSIEEGTRVFDKKGLDIYFSLQDDGRTLKIFVSERHGN